MTLLQHLRSSKLENSKTFLGKQIFGILVTIISQMKMLSQNLWLLLVCSVVCRRSPKKTWMDLDSGCSPRNRFDLLLRGFSPCCGPEQSEAVVTLSSTLLLSHWRRRTAQRGMVRFFFRVFPRILPTVIFRVSVTCRG